MKIIFNIIFILSCTLVGAQTSANVLIGTDVVTYKFKTIASSYSVGIDAMDVADNGFIKEAVLGYNRSFDKDNIMAGIYVGKKLNNLYLRSGARVVIPNGNLHACALIGYRINTDMIFNVDYSYILNNIGYHTVGANLLYRFY